MATTSATLVRETEAVSHDRPARQDGPARNRVAEETDRLFRLIARARSRDRDELRERIVLLNMPIARAVARRYADRGIDADDLEQVAYEGLLKSVARYDPSHNKDFLAFAVPTIRGELKRHFRDRGWMVRPPRRVTELQAQISATSGPLTQTLGRSPRPSDLATALGRGEEEIIEALACDGAFTPTSLDVPTGEQGTMTIGDLLGADDSAVDRAEARLVLGPAVQALGERDRLIVELRFVQGCTQQAIAEQIGVTQMQVSRLLGRILADLRNALGG